MKEKKSNDDYERRLERIRSEFLKLNYLSSPGLLIKYYALQQKRLKLSLKDLDKYEQCLTCNCLKCYSEATCTRCDYCGDNTRIFECGQDYVVYETDCQLNIYDVLYQIRWIILLLDKYSKYYVHTDEVFTYNWSEGCYCLLHEDEIPQIVKEILKGLL